jgi:hypothetical protein
MRKTTPISLSKAPPFTPIQPPLSIISPQSNPIKFQSKPPPNPPDKTQVKYEKIMVKFP